MRYAICSIRLGNVAVATLTSALIHCLHLHMMDQTWPPVLNRAQLVSDTPLGRSCGEECIGESHSRFRSVDVGQILRIVSYLVFPKVMMIATCFVIALAISSGDGRRNLKRLVSEGMLLQ